MDEFSSTGEGAIFLLVAIIWFILTTKLFKMENKKSMEYLVVAVLFFGGTNFLNTALYKDGGALMALVGAGFIFGAAKLAASFSKPPSKLERLLNGD